MIRALSDIPCAGESVTSRIEPQLDRSCRKMDETKPILLSPPDVGELEREYLMRSFDGGWIAPVGPDLALFERDLSDLTGWPGVVAVSSGTAALHLALIAIGVGAGDHVFVSTFTFIATVNAITYCGAIPVFIDSSPEDWNMSPGLLAEALDHHARLGRLPKAVVVVDLYGQCANYDEITPICSKYGIPIVEDSAESVGSTYRSAPAGTFGAVAAFSFNGNKIMTTSGGGAVVCSSESAATRVRYLATQARQPALHYEHTEVGFNYRLSNLLAALGRAQLVRLSEMIERRKSHWRTYTAELGNLSAVEFMPVVDPGWNHWLTCLTFESVDLKVAVEQRLQELNIESRPVWKPMHLQPVFAQVSSFEDGTSSDLFDRGMCLPSGSALSADDVGLVANLVRDCVQEFNG